MVKTNGYDTDAAEEFLERVENIEKEMESDRGAYMAKCKAHREDIKEVLSEAESEHGFDPKVMKILIQERKLLKKIKDAPNGLDIDATSQYDALTTALGAFADTALGGAALDAARKENRANGSAAATDQTTKKKKKKAPVGTAENTAKAN